MTTSATGQPVATASVGAPQGAAGNQPTNPAPSPAPKVRTTIDAVAGDDRVNYGEALAGVRVTGTALANALVQVQWGGTTHAVTTDANGHWSSVFARNEIPVSTAPQETYAAVTARLVAPFADATTTATRQVLIDVTPPAAPTIQAVTGDGKINAAEAAAGVNVSGTAEAGATVNVVWGQAVRTVKVDNAGNWTATFAAAEVTANATARDITASTVDASGNTGRSAVQAISVDLVAPREPVIAPVAGDDRVTAAEAQAGVPVFGMAEPLAKVEVHWGNIVKTVQTDTQGRWTADFSKAEVLSGPTGKVDVTAKAMDALGNVSAVTHHAVTVEATALSVNQTAAAAADGGVAVMAMAAATAAPVASPSPAVPMPPDITPVGGDYRVNAGEAKDGVIVDGHARPNQRLLVTWGQSAKIVTASDSGWWWVMFKDADIPATTALKGETSKVTLMSLDPSTGYPTQLATSSVLVDRVLPAAPVVTTVTSKDAPKPGETIVGLQVSGTAEPDTLVRLAWGTNIRMVAVDATGKWTTSYTAAEATAGNGKDLDASGLDQSLNIGPAITRRLNAEVPVIQTVSGDDRVNAAEAAAGVQVTGLAVANRQVQVEWGKTTKVVTTDATGHWKASFAQAELPAQAGSAQISTDVIAKVIDPVAGTSSIAAKRSVVVDTVAPTAKVTLAVEGDDRVTNSEGMDGVVVHGSSESGSSVVVHWGAATRTVTTDALGAWDAKFDWAEIRTPDTKSVGVTFQATDALGNVGPVGTRTVVVEGAPIHQATTISKAAQVFTPKVIAGMPAQEFAGIDLAGTADSNAVVQVTLGGYVHSTVSDAKGNWSLWLSAPQVQAINGVQTAVRAQLATDTTGSHEASIMMLVDNVAPHSPLIVSVAGDNLLNAAELTKGVPVTGVSEPDTVVTVNWGGVLKTVAADGMGNWSTTYSASDLKSAQSASSVQAIAADKVGNSSNSSSTQVIVDVIAPKAPILSAIAGDDRVSPSEAASAVTVAGKTEAYAMVDVAWGTQETHHVRADGTGQWSTTFSPQVLQLSQGRTVDVSARANDVAGNAGDWAHRLVTVDAAASVATAGVQALLQWQAPSTQAFVVDGSGTGPSSTWTTTGTAISTLALDLTPVAQHAVLA